MHLNKNVKTRKFLYLCLTVSIAIASITNFAYSEVQEEVQEEVQTVNSRNFQAITPYSEQGSDQVVLAGTNLREKPCLQSKSIGYLKKGRIVRGDGSFEIPNCGHAACEKYNWSTYSTHDNESYQWGYMQANRVK